MGHELPSLLLKPHGLLKQTEVRLVVCPPVYRCGPNRNISMNVGGIALKFGTDIHVAQMATANVSDDPLSHHEVGI